ncbi:MAG: cytidine deaminase [Puia sp.]|nr:cytidine deaminase [Puia sp.]
MQNKEYSFIFAIYDHGGELGDSDSQLLNGARSATRQAYAPYSRFRVGAAAKLTNGEIVRGSNQENAAFPAGLCAEGVVLATAASLYPGVAIETLAISYDDERGPSNKPITPCGICRQSIKEFERKTGQPIRLLLGGLEGQVWLVEKASMLLPLAFEL